VAPQVEVTPCREKNILFFAQIIELSLRNNMIYLNIKPYKDLQGMSGAGFFIFGTQVALHKEDS
jgi:hypothetical protein